MTVERADWKLDAQTPNRETAEEEKEKSTREPTVMNMDQLNASYRDHHYWGSQVIPFARGRSRPDGTTSKVGLFLIATTVRITNWVISDYVETN